MNAQPSGCRPLILAVALLQGLPASAAAMDSESAGRRLYREGLGRDGSPVTAVVQGDVSVTGRMLACVNCHRRSGLGTSEGGQRTPAITAPALFEPAAPNLSGLRDSRAVYTDDTLARAITAGVAADGRSLSPLMPRYRLDASESRALTAYLHTLGAARENGVTGTDIELVTIVAADAPASQREAVTTVVRRFAESINGGTRQETRRALASRRHPYGERHARMFRRWNVSVWTLEGPAATWPAQLERLYRQKPPFAVISGAAGTEWPVVHRFCEQHELPCILPVTPLPVETGNAYYTIYYSAGVRLEARVTARSIAAVAGDPARRILVLHVDDVLGRAALEAFAAALPESQRAGLRSLAISPVLTPTTQDWAEHVDLGPSDVLVAWLAPPQLQSFAAIAARPTGLPRHIYTASTFTDWRTIRAPPQFEQRVHHVFPYRIGEDGRTPFPREDNWLKRRGLSELERIPAAEALFASHIAGEAMFAMADNYSRDYFIETLEHMLDGTEMTTVYPLTTLGTGQRFLAKGAYVLRLDGGAIASRYVSSEWVQP